MNRSSPPIGGRGPAPARTAPAGWVAGSWWTGLTTGVSVQVLLIGIVSGQLWALVGDPDGQRATGHFGLLNLGIVPAVVLFRVVGGRLPKIKAFSQGLLFSTLIGAMFVSALIFGITRLD